MQLMKYKFNFKISATKIDFLLSFILSVKSLRDNCIFTFYFYSMRLLFVFVLMMFAAALNAQIYSPYSSFNYLQRPAFASSIHLNDSIPNKKWFVTKYAGVSTSFNFFRGGNATVVAAPLSLQLNRAINNNLYAFANVSIAPEFVSFNNNNFVNSNIKGIQNTGYHSNGVGMYSSASIGLTYVNDARTFSISGGISVERSTYPGMPYNQMDAMKPVTPLPVNDDKRLH